MRENHYAILVQCLEFPTFSTYKKAYRFLLFRISGIELPQSEYKITNFSWQTLMFELISTLRICNLSDYHTI